MKKYFTALLILIYQISFAQNTFKKLSDGLAASYLKNQSGALVIGIFDNGKKKIFYYGETEKGNGILPDSNSIFEIGNISETFTSILFADRTLKGVMHIDDKLQNYLPVNVPSPVYQPVVCRPMQTEKENNEFRDEPNMKVHFTPYTCVPDSSYKPQPILLCYLATHTSGLPDLPDNIQKHKINPFADYKTEDLYNFLSHYTLINPIGFDYNYSRAGIALLGTAISLKMKKDFENVLIENILDSLRMNDTRINIPDNRRNKLLQGYDQKNIGAEHQTFNSFAPALGLNSTPSDMMTFLSANISLQKNYYTNLLDFTHNSRLTPGQIPGGEMEIALGWKIKPFNEDAKRIVWQSGRTNGFASYIGFVETSHTGVIVLSSASKNVNEIGTEILKLLEKEKLTTE